MRRAGRVLSALPCRAQVNSHVAIAHKITKPKAEWAKVRGAFKMGMLHEAKKSPKAD
jgi:hypothetical protein